MRYNAKSSGFSVKKAFSRQGHSEAGRGVTYFCLNAYFESVARTGATGVGVTDELIDYDRRRREAVITDDNKETKD